MSMGRPHHFGHLLASLKKKSLQLLILYKSFHDLINAYSHWSGADKPLEAKFWCQQKQLVTSVFATSLKKISLKSWFYTQFFHDFIHVYSPRAGADNPLGQNFDVKIKALSLCPFFANFKRIPLNSDCITYFSIKWLSNILPEEITYERIRKQSWHCHKKRSRSTQGQHLNELCWAEVLDAAYQAPRSLALWFQRRRFLEVFTIYGRGGHLGHVT